MERKCEISLTISLDKDFFRFLRRRGCLKQYFNNIKGYRKESEKSVKNFFENQEDTVNTVLYAAFSWDESPEGYEFWHDLSEEWRKQCLPEWYDGECEVKVHWVDLEAWTKIFEEGLLAGKRYCVRDNSWNRPALAKWQKNTWNFNGYETGWIDLVTLYSKEGLLILSDYPVEKTMVNGPDKKSYPEKFVKVLLPDGRVWWVIYVESCVF